MGVYIVPQWFFGYDVIFQLAFTIVALLVSMVAFNVYRLTGQKQSGLFGIGFLLIAIAYLVKTFLNFSVLAKINGGICNFMNISDVATLYSRGTYLHLIFFIAGLLALAFMTQRMDNWKTRLLFGLAIFIPLLFSANTFLVFYLLSTLLLIFIAGYYLEHYLAHKQPRTLLVLIGFLFFMLSSAHFIFSGNAGMYYVLGHVFELIAYLLILTNVLLVRK